MLMYLIPLVWIILILANIKILKNPRDTGFTKEQSLALRGISAVEIMLGHISMYGDSTALFVFRKSGILFVGIFFALSGYGLAYSIKERAGYLKGFVLKKILILLIPAFFAYLISLAGLAVQYSYRVFDELQRPWMFPLSVNWFIWELLGFYLVTYICARVGDLRKTHIAVLICGLVFIVIAFLAKLENPWYGSTLCFWLGIVYYEYREELCRIWLDKRNLATVIVLGIVCLGSAAGFMLLGDGFLGNVILRNLASVSFVAALMLILPYVKVENPVSRWLGTISFEIYLLHVSVVTLFEYLIKDIFVSSIVSIAMTIVLAYIFMYITKLIKKLINKGEKK